MITPAIRIILEGAIMSLLIYGSYTDLKARHVSNKISLTIAAMAIILFSPQILTLKTIIAIFLISSWAAHMIGSADVKVMVPIIYMFDPLQVIVFMVMLFMGGVTIGIYYLYKFGVKTGIRAKIPGYIPISAALFISLLSPYLFVIR